MSVEVELSVWEITRECWTVSLEETGAPAVVGGTTTSAAEDAGAVTGAVPAVMVRKNSRVADFTPIGMAADATWTVVHRSSTSSGVTAPRARGGVARGTAHAVRRASLQSSSSPEYVAYSESEAKLTTGVVVAIEVGEKPRCWKVLFGMLLS